MTRLGLIFLIAWSAWGQSAKEWNARVSALRSTPDDVCGAATRKLAVEIRAMPHGTDQVNVADHLAALSTEGDFGQATLQEVTDTLADALRAAPSKADGPYNTLAERERLEHVVVRLDDLRYSAAKVRLRKATLAREKVGFVLKDLAGKSWSLTELRGKVVLVNLWATWCPPCRKEMPDLDALAKEYGPKGLVVLGITNEDAAVARKYLAEHPYGYPILLDDGGKVTKAYDVTGIPKSFIYNREGKIAAESIDMRTLGQFRELLAQAGLN